MTNAQDLLQIDAEEVEHGGSRDLVVDGLEDVELEGLNLLNGNLLMSNFLIDHLHFEGVDVLVLGGHEHACHTYYVEFADLADIWLVLKVAIHEADC